MLQVKDFRSQLFKSQCFAFASLNASSYESKRSGMKLQVLMSSVRSFSRWFLWSYVCLRRISDGSGYTLDYQRWLSSYLLVHQTNCAELHTVVGKKLVIILQPELVVAFEEFVGHPHFDCKCHLHCLDGAARGEPSAEDEDDRWCAHRPR